MDSAHTATRTATLHFGTGTAGPFYSKAAPLRTSEAPVNRSRTGYGRKIPMCYEVRYNGRWRRVYVCCYSNAGTAYIEDREAAPFVRPGGSVARYPWIVVSI